MKRVLLLTTICIATVLTAMAQPRAYIPQLANDSTYTRLFDVQKLHTVRLDSLTTMLDQARAEYATDSDNGAKYSQRITSLESQIFDLQSDASLVDEQLAAIEQKWAVENLNNYTPIATDNNQEVMHGKIANHSIGEDKADLVENAFFADNMTANDYDALRLAQYNQRGVDTYIQIYRFNHNKLRAVDSMYFEATNLAHADSLYAEHERLMQVNNMIADSVADKWNGLFDTKIYSYNYILDKCRQTEMLDDFRTKMSEYRIRETEITGAYSNDVVASYPYAKALLLYYEIKMADALSIYIARDSLNRVLETIDDRQYLLASIPDLRRADVEYTEIDVSSPAKYNSRNPIPEMQTPEQGDVYRIQLGNYSSQAQISTFKGVWPLAVERKEDRRYYYYAGIYPTLQSTVSAMERLRKLGFKNPIVKYWHNGESDVQPAMQSSSATSSKSTSSCYRIEITGVESLSDNSKAIIATTGKEISRIAGNQGSYTFLVGVFSDIEQTRALVDSLKAIDEKMEIKILEIAQ